MPDWAFDAMLIGLAVVLVALNGFFVAAEFALVKVRIGQLEELVRKKKMFAKSALWLANRLDESLSACQLGITMASLALGWVAEPTFGRLLSPLFHAIGLKSENLIHGLTFVVAFSIITAVHLVIGEQAPKIFAIRRPQVMALWCAPLLIFFYVILYPFLAGLNWATSLLLRLLGVKGASDHGTAHTEDEIRALLTEAHVHGQLTGSEHRLLHAVFEFDDLICRRVMVPRGDVVFFDIKQPFTDCIDVARRTKHTRYPVCEGSLDKVNGVVHLKDLIGLDAESADIDLSSFMRPPRKVPESMPISRLLKHFQATHQLLAFVVDEYGTTIGIVTLENVLEQIVGPVEDEFDSEDPAITPSGPGQYIVRGSTPIEEVEKALNVELDEDDVDTVSGVLMTRTQKMPSAGDRIDFEGATAEILEVRDERAYRIRFTIGDEAADHGGKPPA